MELQTSIINDVKKKISPPNGVFCPISVNEIYLIAIKHELQDIILKEVERFNNSIQEEFKKLGYTYFLITLSQIVPECIINNEWLQYI